MSGLQLLYEGNSEATIYIGNLDSRVNEEIIQELFIQAGPVVNVFLPRDKITCEHQGYGFVEFKSEDDADYAIKIMHMVKLYGKPLKANKASQDRKSYEVGANIFIGNLDADVDEKMLYDTFSVFGVILSTNIMRDPETGMSQGFAFVSYDNFESSDSAIAAMNQQYFCNRLIKVQYAFKKDTKGERHGTAAERLLAANRPNAIQKTAIQPSLIVRELIGQQNPNYQQTLHMSQQLLSNQNPHLQSLQPQMMQAGGQNVPQMTNLRIPPPPMIPPNQAPQGQNLPPIPSMNMLGQQISSNINIPPPPGQITLFKGQPPKMAPNNLTPK